MGKTSAMLGRKRRFIGALIAVLIGLLSYQAVKAAAAEPVDPVTDQPSAAPSSDEFAGEYLVLYHLGRSTSQATPDFGSRSVTFLDDGVFGFQAELTQDEVTALQADPDVNVVLRVDVPLFDWADLSSSGLPFGYDYWGLDRIDQRVPELDFEYEPVAHGAGVDIYILDSGVDASHEQFDGRVVGGVSFVDGSPDPFDDCNGHGTKVASAAAGRTTGVANQANIYSVKIMDCNGRADTSALPSAVDWIIQNSSGPSVVNISNTRPSVENPLWDPVVDPLTRSGLAVVVAAGNENEDACLFAPANDHRAITVGSTGFDDAKVAVSNFGRCVDIFAPGDSISVATANGGLSKSGATSISTGMVSGAAAIFLEGSPNASPGAVRTALLDNATKGVVGNANGGADRLLYVGPPDVDSQVANPDTMPESGTGSTDPNRARPEITRAEYDGSKVSLAWQGVKGDTLVFRVRDERAISIAFTSNSVFVDDDGKSGDVYYVESFGYQAIGKSDSVTASGASSVEVAELSSSPEPIGADVPDQGSLPVQPGVSESIGQPAQAEGQDELSVCRSDVIDGSDLAEARKAFGRPVAEGGCGFVWKDKNADNYCEWVPGATQGWRCVGDRS